MTIRSRTEALSPSHDRASFRCGNDRIDRYSHETVTQDIKRRLAGCLVAVEHATGKLAGFYTLSPSTVLLNVFPNAPQEEAARTSAHRGWR